MNNSITISIDIPDGFMFADQEVTAKMSDFNGQKLVTINLLANKIEQNPHQELIDLSEDYNQKYPDLWRSLFQIKHDGTWKHISHLFEVFNLNCEYRIHPHAENIIKWNQCNDEDKQRWEWRYTSDGAWFPYCMDRGEQWSKICEYRLKPKTIRIGKYDVPEPIREPLQDGQNYWVFNLPQNNVFEITWSSKSLDMRWLNNGLLFSTKEDADLMLKAILSMLEQKS
jgi:hypothetical protein